MRRPNQAIIFNGLAWVPLHPQAQFEMLGYIPTFLSVDDSRPAAAQIQSNYPFGDWSPFPGFTLLATGNLKYPGDPPTQALWETKLREELITFYQHAWLRITQPDGTWEVCRLD
jgi:hypothetical protein